MTSHSQSHSHSSTAANLVGIHYRVGKKIGEGSFGVIFEGVPFRVKCFEHFNKWTIGTNLLNSQTVAIKFACVVLVINCNKNNIRCHRNPGRQKRHSCETNVVPTVYLLGAVSPVSECYLISFC